MDAVIIAGGKGTRLGLKKIPKPMVDFDGKPLLEYQINQLKRYNFKNIYILSGYLSSVIINYFKDGSDFGVKLNHVVESKPLGTAGALKQIQEIISERFLVIYGDTFFDIDIKKIINYDHKINAENGTLFCHPNDHPYDSDIIISEGNFVKKFLPKPHSNDKFFRNNVNAAFYILSKNIFKYIDCSKNLDLGRDIFPNTPDFSFASYKSSEYIKDIGTKKRLSQVLSDYKNGKTKLRNLEIKQRAIFLDRDGVLNYEKEPFVSYANFIIYNDVIDFFKLLKPTIFLSIIVTNQPSIAKGFISFNELENIHSKLDYQLSKNNLFIDDIFFCPHHPEKGFEGELKELKIDCNCRKPNSGMIEKAVKHYNIDVEGSWLIGDRYTDIKAAQNVNVKTILIERGHNGNDKNKFINTEPDFKVQNLLEAFKIIKKYDNI